MSIALISHVTCREHDPGPGHPECAARLSAIDDALIASHAELLCQRYSAVPVTREQLVRVHASRYIEQLFAVAPHTGYVALDADTVMSAGTLPAALHAAGAGVQAVDLVMTGKHAAAFCAVRPPGHHARRNQGLGFCFFNNVAVATKHALEHYALSRVAIVDFDIHHGNGTEEIFRNDARVMLCSTFESGNYASQWAGQNDSRHLNIALQDVSSGRTLRDAYRGSIVPALDAFAPQLILFSAGFDGHCEDELSRACFRESDYGWITAQVRTVALRHANGRMVSTLEGGYALDALGRCVVAHVQALAGEPVE